MNANKSPDGGCCAGEPVKRVLAGGRAKSAPRKAPDTTPRKASSAGVRGEAAPGMARAVPRVVRAVRVREEAGWVGGVLVELRFSVVAGFVFRVVAGKGGGR